jgi:putative transposase
MQAKRPRRGTQAWQALMAQFADSGLSAAAFCRREAINVASFYQWRARLSASSDAVPVRSDRVATAGFVDIGTLHASDPIPAAFELRLDLGGGLTLQLRRG